MIVFSIYMYIRHPHDPCNLRPYFLAEWLELAGSTLLQKNVISSNNPGLDTERLSI